MKKILIIDDDEQIRTLLTQMLVKEGFETRDAPDGRKGLELYRESRADIVITDILMPEREGLETIMELKKMDPEVKIIAISGGGMINAEFYLQFAKEFGALRTIQKPFGRKEILETIRKLIPNEEI